MLQQPRLIGLCGQARHGKTTVADYLQEKYGYAEASFAAPIKEMSVRALVKNPPPDPLHGGVRLYQDYEGQTPEEYWRHRIYKDRTAFTRWLMQFIGTDIFRHEEDEAYWVKRWKREYYSSKNFIVIPDVRFINEAAEIRSLGGEVWRIVRINAKVAVVEAGVTHQSETEMLKIREDRNLVAPDGIENLHHLVDGIMGKYV